MRGVGNRGANLEHQDKEGRMPLDYALELEGEGHDLVYLLVHAVGQQGCVSLLLRTLRKGQNLMPN